MFMNSFKTSQNSKQLRFTNFGFQPTLAPPSISEDISLELNEKAIKLKEQIKKSRKRKRIRKSINIKKY